MMLSEVEQVGSAALPVAALAGHLRLGSAFAMAPDQDSLLESYLRAALAAIEARTGKALFARPFLLQVTRWRGGADHPLPVAPVARLERVVLVDRAGGEAEVPPARYWLAADLHRPRLVGRGAVLPPVPDDGRVVIELVAGFGPSWEDIPADLRQAVMLLAAEYYERRHDDGAARHGLPLPVAGLIEGWRQVRVLGGARP